LYGTTAQGGQFDHGVAFEISGTSETVLHDFCAEPDCTDGGAPGTGGLFMDASGALYGSAPTGGKADEGILYRLKGKSYKVLVDFCRKPNCADGARPEGAVTMDADGNLFGVTPIGGSDTSSGGIAYEYGKKLKVLYSFCGPNCDAGGRPLPRVLLDGSGNIFGTTEQGRPGGGTVFELTP
jgi:uncharacterized repeat protein (TIGR03803 family)